MRSATARITYANEKELANEISAVMNLNPDTLKIRFVVYQVLPEGHHQIENIGETDVAGPYGEPPLTKAGRPRAFLRDFLSPYYGNNPIEMEILTQRDIDECGYC